MEDLFYPLLKQYYKSPQWIKSLVGSLYNKIPQQIRYGDSYQEYSKILNVSQYWSREKIAAYQLSKLKITVLDAYNNVPFYRQKFDFFGIHPKDLNNFSDFQKFPFMNRDDIRQNLHRLTSHNKNKTSLMEVTTGGSSGAPIKLFYQKGLTRSKELAFTHSLWSRSGYRIGDKIAVLRGYLLGSDQNNRFYAFDPIKNRLLLSSFHLIEENIQAYLKLIIKFRPKFIHAYPSSLSILSNYMEKYNVEKFPSVKAILTSSETLFPWQRKLFSKVFSCPLFDFYGHVEACVIASTCEAADSIYHVSPEYGYYELIDVSSGEPIKKEGAIGEIVGTSFDNYGMPLIRYRTGDLAINTNVKCKCGRNYPSIKTILGRKQDFFVDKNNTLVTFISADMPLWDIIHKITAYQYCQSEPGKVILHIESESILNSSDLNTISKTFSNYYPNIQIKIKRATMIPKTIRGKFQYLVQKLPIDLSDLNIEIS